MTEFTKNNNLYKVTLIPAKAVIPAPYPVVGSNRQVRDKLQQESRKALGFPRIKYGAGLVKPGMTNRIRLMSTCIAL